MKDLPYELWEPVIGLEIHAQLNTRSKLFSTAPNRFGDEPNTNISYVCTGQPGSLPIINQEAVRKGVQFGLAIQASISQYSIFERKSYFYPDSPRNYQITQYEHPLIRGGTIYADVDGVSKTFKVNRAQLEDDAGMLKHFTNFAGVDYNRAGAPLIEIVSEPCIHTPKEASAYAMAIRSILLYLDACDGNMEEGSLRIDVNISVRPKGETSLRPRVEIKNMNSFSFLEMAIEAEISRQIALYTSHPLHPHLELIPPGTYRWDAEAKQTVLMRAKESADDYRYFPEPDLAPLIITQDYIDQILDQLPELPHNRFKRYVSDLGLTEYAASVLIHEKFLSDYFEEANEIAQNPRLLCNWIMVEFAGRIKERGTTFLNCGIPPRHVAKLVQMIDQNKITGRIAKNVADEMVASPNLDPEIIVKTNPDYQPIDDITAIEPIVDQVIAENPQSIIDFQAGKEKAFAFLVGQVMKLTKGKAPPQTVNDLLRKKISRN
ncbi:MAG TPA: Asp-tRNA(Asn)/Glu-tRNA(Gln) amidotransferase subunit GatB [Chlamydiales bacterium]|nr:Asp-tRNA(Asn)/Glu-tRNA(Gln) amidotransferase subunit GatB [Chlamydiales bacterium]